ncbi:DNA polymerase III subunit chi [Falsirhodobacter halotolerans]|uniref:DNA polymerase III subunit chi n=1 Tax=Falsirhodobacter halotolerans TaxID=1146892 RepID=UPI001FD50322|nr:DNA polymerase III subunit chi [Falsirhodobacter halotolerans]MCJ8139761.1 DNA polymerase III subunit chi [Falsirhodobacter halotolerans]
MFYHLTQSGAEETAHTLLSRAHGAGWRVLVRGTDAARLDALDRALWTLRDDSFLPHGIEGGAHDAAHPVLLGLTASGPAEGLMLVDGATLDPAEVAGRQRVWILFDGLDDAAVAHARDQWRTVVAAGHAAQYWSEEGGRWEKKAERQPDAG